MSRIFCPSFCVAHCAGGGLMEDTGEECVRACGLEEEEEVYVGVSAVNTCANGDGHDNGEE